MPPLIRDGLAELIAELDAAAPEGLPGARSRFRDCRPDKGQGDNRLLHLRFELLVAAQLQRAGALSRIRSDTPDFDCRWGEHQFGVEVTTRARDEVGAALEAALERCLWHGPDVNVTLMRTGKLLFSERPGEIARIADQVSGEIRKSIADAGEQFGNVSKPELGLTAMWRAGMESTPGMRVSYQSVLVFTDEEWTHHWKMATLQVKDTLEEKGRKPYSLPSIVVVDVSQLGETSRLLSAEGIAKYQDVLDNCDLGNLRGALLVKTTLTSRVIEPLCWRGTIRSSSPSGPWSSVSR
jgi:hypothetical protein